jgi:Amt family ammonium transporter
MTNVSADSFPQTAPAIPGIAFALYQLQFAGIAAAIIFGSVSERIRLIPAMLFTFLWTTFIYDFIASWTWSSHGWLRNLTCLNLTAPSAKPCGVGAYDYSGGGPVHMAGGFTALAYCLFVGRRKDYKPVLPQGHNLPLVVIGTALSWFGWFGFNGGAALSSSPRAAMAAFVTVLAPAACGITWCLLDYHHTKKLSAISFCSGVMGGLVAITPGSGYVAPWASIVIGIVGGFVFRFGAIVKYKLGFDDALDAFNINGFGGLYGNIMTGIFAQKWIGALDRSSIDGGWVDGNFAQVGYQLIACLVTAIYAFFGSWALLYLINKIPGMHLRQEDHAEELGGDMDEVGEIAYDYMALLDVEQADKRPSKLSLDTDLGSDLSYIPEACTADSEATI